MTLSLRDPSTLDDLLNCTLLDRPRTSRATASLAAKRLAERRAAQGDARRARIVHTDSGRQLYGEVFPQFAAINVRVMAVLDDSTAQALDRALAQLTAQAVQLNGEIARDVRADRRA